MEEDLNRLEEEERENIISPSRPRCQRMTRKNGQVRKTVPVSAALTPNFMSTLTVFENHRKSLIQHCDLRAKRATFTFSVDKSSSKRPKMVHFGEFLKT